LSAGSFGIFDSSSSSDSSSADAGRDLKSVTFQAVNTQLQLPLEELPYAYGDVQRVR
jgi:hypothetical protein